MWGPLLSSGIGLFQAMSNHSNERARINIEERHMREADLRQIQEAMRANNNQVTPEMVVQIQQLIRQTEADMQRMEKQGEIDKINMEADKFKAQLSRLESEKALKEYEKKLLDEASKSRCTIL